MWHNQKKISPDRKLKTYIYTLDPNPANCRQTSEEIDKRETLRLIR